MVELAALVLEHKTKDWLVGIGREENVVVGLVTQI
jgi:hypothetical protein